MLLYNERVKVLGHIFNEKILSKKNMLEPIITKSLISGLDNYSLWKRLYSFHDKTLLKMNQVMENHVRVEEASVTRKGYYRFQIAKSL